MNILTYKQLYATYPLLPTPPYPSFWLASPKRATQSRRDSSLCKSRPQSEVNKCIFLGAMGKEFNNHSVLSNSLLFGFIFTLFRISIIL